MVSVDLVPITLFLVIGGIVVAALYFRNEKLKYEGGGEYRKLAEEATRGQKALLDQMRIMNETLGEIERLLREV